MPDNLVKDNGNVLLIDPNLVNVNPDMTNAIPQYQDMFIFAELTAIRRARTVLVTGVQGSGSYTTDNTGANKAISVNFLGTNQDPESPNYLKFTTNWYDGSSGDHTQFEGFGIGSIKVVINSSFVPQVNIQFIDLRGLAFFNQENSPYRTIFDFPPPIFTLKIKGYYGKALQYQLHLVKYTTEFKAENGNFIIDAQFVAMTFAPLADVLFRYVVNFPLITGGTMNPTSTQPPQNTYALILKLKNLYSGIAEKQKSSSDTKIYNSTIAEISTFDGLLSALSLFADDADLSPHGKALAFVGRMDTITSKLVLTPLASIFDYNNIIKLTGNNSVDQNVADRLIIAYPDASTAPKSSTASIFTLGSITPADDKLSALKTYRTKLTSNANTIVTTNDIPVPTMIDSNANSTTNYVTTNTNNSYAALDVTYYYIKLYNKKAELQKQKTAVMNQINTTINNLVIQDLGMRPTIYNIFKVILDDVDTFFRTLRSTSIKAETDHHVKHRSQILTGNFKDVGGNNGETIYAFPLVIQQKKEQCSIKETRIAPIELSNSIIGDPFPELVLVQDFIDSFITQRILTEQMDMRSAQNADGTYKWIPISPYDSTLGTPDNKSPYFGVDTSGGGSTSSPINTSSNPRMVQVLTIALKRFYVLTQYAFPDKFYSDSNYVDLFSKSEAINLVASIFNPTYTDLLSNFAKDYQTNPDAFYTWVKDNVPDLYKFPAGKYDFFNILDGDKLTEVRPIDDVTHEPEYIEGDTYVNKGNFNFHGFNVHQQGISVQVTPTTTPATDTNNPVQSFLSTTARSGWKKFWQGIKIEDFIKYTDENVFFVKDGDDTGSGQNLGINTKTRFLTEAKEIYVLPNANTMLYRATESGVRPEAQYSRPDFIKLINQTTGGVINGNTAWNKLDTPAIPNTFARQLQAYSDIVETWVTQLANHDDEIYQTIINFGGPQYNPRLSATVLLSNFGYTLSPFNIYPNILNEMLFTLPAAIEIPSYLPYYMGALVDINNNMSDPNYKALYDFFVTGPGHTLDSTGVLIFADIVDINNQLATADKQLIKDLYDKEYITAGIYNNMIGPLKNLYDTVKNDPSVTSASSPNEKLIAKAAVYRKELDPTNGSGFFNTILKPFVDKFTIVNYSQLSFKRNPAVNSLYKSISTTNTSNKTAKDANDNYFKQFFQNVFKGIGDKQKQIKDQKTEDSKLTGDEDIVTQTYYSFKNINDKWLTGPQNNDPNAGYPLFEKSRGGSATPHLIDSFVFVDRAMNPIGDTIINPEILTNMLEDQNMSIYSVLTQLLSLNGFEFFPLQNFMKFEKPMDWQESFMIDTIGEIDHGPTFVCMYIGGGSSYPSGIQAFGQFKDDGITDLLSNIPDFSKGNCSINSSDDNQVATNPTFPFRQVRAFRVRFGEQNQSMFTNIRIDSKDYPETNESIQILARLAGDNKLQAPTPKGQNLYNLYENRAYRATVTGLGNAMIQPTQYFQVENVPLYNGAYLVLSVEHQIDPNKMTTTFSGTKILKYPVPRVLQPSAIVGYEGGNTDDTNPAASSVNGVTVGPTAGTASGQNVPQSQYNSMYNFKIK